MIKRASGFMRGRFLKAPQAAYLAVGLFLAGPRFGSPLRLDASHLANRLAGENITIVEATVFLASPKQADLFTKPNRTDGIGFTSGVVLSSAWAAEEAGKNDNVYSPGSDNLKGPGYLALDKMLPAGIVSADACILQIIFRCKGVKPTVSFDFVYGTDEYPWSSTGSGNKDVMGAFLAGEEPKHNIVLLYGPELTQKNSTKVSAKFKSNIIPLYRTEMNGFTPPMSVSAAAQWASTVNVLYVAVADTGSKLGPLTNSSGAWLFIKAGSLKCRSNYTPNDNDDDFALNDDNDDFVLNDGSQAPSVSPYPTASPYPTRLPRLSTHRPTPSSNTVEPTLVPTSLHAQPTSAVACADGAWDKCQKCGYRTCFNRYLNSECVIGENTNYWTYRSKVLRRIDRRYC